MSTIWVVESTKDMFSTAHVLMGDFPTRLFRSLDSMVKLSRMNGTEKPDVLVIDESVLNSKSDFNLTTVIEEFRDYAQIVFFGVDEKKFPAGINATFIDRQADPISLSKMVKELLSSGSSKKFLIKKGDLVLHTKHQWLLIGENESDKEQLTTREVKILECLMENIGRCVTRDDLAKHVWQETKVSEQTINSHISRLRKTIEKSEYFVLQGVYGKGYTLGEMI